MIKRGSDVNEESMDHAAMALVAIPEDVESSPPPTSASQYRHEKPQYAAYTLHVATRKDSLESYV